MQTEIFSDYAAEQDLRNTKILSKVGIPNFKQFRKNLINQRVLTVQEAYIDLRNRKNGAHMSRLVDAMRSRHNEPISIYDNILEDLKASHKDCGTRTAYWSCAWEDEYKMENGQELFVKAELSGSLNTKGHETWFLTTWTPYTSVCPCSAEMVAEAEYGHPHMQRATAKVVGILLDGSDLDETLTTTIATVVNTVGLVPQPYMKRPDELKWCKNAQDYNLFVEDAARQIADAMDKLYSDYTVGCTHEESIHQHNVFALHRKGGQLL